VTDGQVSQEPTGVLRRLGDQLVAPGANRGELLAVYAAAVAGSALAVVLAVDAGLPTLSSAVVAVVAFDLFGGSVANATAAAKRRFHGPGRGWRQHLGFVVVHVQPFLLALAVPGFGWAAAAAIYGLVVAGALAVLATPPGLRRPVAFGTTTFALTVALAGVTVPAALAWFAPVLLVKLLLGHLLPEEAGA
jgi:hypothetical protein